MIVAEVDEAGVAVVKTFLFILAAFRGNHTALIFSFLCWLVW
jgi:hypothetical protein